MNEFNNLKIHRCVSLAAAHSRLIEEIRSPDLLSLSTFHLT